MTFVQRWGFFILAALLLYLARGIITPFILAAILAYIFSPLVDSLQQRIHAPRILVVLGFYIVLVGGLVLLGYLISGQLADELDALRQQGPDIVGNIVQQFTGGKDITLFGNTITPVQVTKAINQSIHDFAQTPSGALGIGKSVVEGLLNFILMLLVMFYMLLDGKRLGTALLRFVPEDRREHISTIAGNIHRVLGFYLRGQLLLILLVSVVMYLILHFIFGLRYALPIAILSGFLEIIPLVGPALAASVAAIVALATLGLGAAAWILITYFIVRQIEDQVVMPLVVGRAVHLHPIITTFAVLAGGAIAGLLGTFLAVPVAAAINVVMNYVYPPPTVEQEPGQAQPINFARQRTSRRNPPVAKPQSTEEEQ